MYFLFPARVFFPEHPLLGCIRYGGHGHYQSNNVQCPTIHSYSYLPPEHAHCLSKQTFWLLRSIVPVPSPLPAHVSSTAGNNIHTVCISPRVMTNSLGGRRCRWHSAAAQLHSVSQRSHSNGNYPDLGDFHPLFLSSWLWQFPRSLLSVCLPGLYERKSNPPRSSHSQPVRMRFWQFQLKFTYLFVC